MKANYLVVPKIDIDDSNIESVAEALSLLAGKSIDVVNWPSGALSYPQVFFRVAHNGGNILLQYEVREQEIMAAVVEDNGMVWTDSCVEMFVTFNNIHYYNSEFSCVGKVRLGCHSCNGKSPDDPKASPHALQLIKRLSTLGTANFPFQKGDFHWTLTLVIPASVYWMDNITDFSGMSGRANFYKCGDGLSAPHYMSWRKVDSQTPNFHLPEFFGDLKFE